MTVRSNQTAEADAKKLSTSQSAPIKVRLRLFWQAVKAARGKAVDVELRRQFMASARKSGLITAVHAASRHGEEDVLHVIACGLKGFDSWGSKEFE